MSPSVKQERGGPKRPRAPGRRSGIEAARTRARVLRHAERLFARKGYNATSVRELARVSGVRMFTIHHHFGSKQRLYEEVLRRWSEEVRELVGRILAQTDDPRQAVERAVQELFDLFLARRDCVALSARAALGEGLPGRLDSAERGWVRFMGTAMASHRLAAPGLDVGLLLITLEGILHHHVLAVSHYRHLFAHDVADPAMAARTKKHLARVILALVGPAAGNRHSSGR
jgi:AcrR family transcriptional regulator